MLELHIGRQNVGIMLVPDAEYPGMWRVGRRTDWRAPMTLSPMMSLPYAKAAAVRLAVPRGLAAKQSARWMVRETPPAGRQQANAGRR
jgi:hypothetical protein